MQQALVGADTGDKAEDLCVEALDFVGLWAVDLVREAEVGVEVLDGVVEELGSMRRCLNSLKVQYWKRAAARVGASFVGEA